MFNLPRRWKGIFRERLLNNWRYKIAALAAAFIIWSYVAGQQSMQAVYKVPVYFQNLPPNTVLADPKVDKIQVTISGRRDRILSIKERQIWVAIELAGMKRGKNKYSVQRSNIVVPAGIEIKSFTPSQIIIRLIRAPQNVDKRATP
ncbi:YbbR-like domain-containing protein [candidate division FCPU426 bacterium]|nr:YbbR-like domain-containing protein [candidate division FCPU426 bacterium]